MPVYFILTILATCRSVLMAVGGLGWEGGAKGLTAQRPEGHWPGPCNKNWKQVKNKLT